MLIALVLVLALSHPSVADDVSWPADDIESWYFYLGVGRVNNTYPDKFQGLFGKDASDLMWGFYLPQGERTLGGVTVRGSSDRWKGPVRTQTKTQECGLFCTFLGIGGGPSTVKIEPEIKIDQTLFFLSAMHFLKHKIGQGPFVQVDVGLANAYVKTKDYQGEVKAADDWGMGFLVGGGYGMPIMSGTRLLVQVNGSLRRIEGEQYMSVGMMLNGLF